MPLNAISSLLLCLPAFLAGVLCARWVFERKHQAERGRMADEMQRRVRGRFEAFMRLESRITRIFGRLKDIEGETSRSLAATGVRLQSLDRALEAHEGAAPSESGLGWMRDFLEQPPKAAAQPVEPKPVLAVEQAPVQGAAPEADAGAALAAWERKLESLRSEKHVELERQGALIVQLTERLRRLEPKTDLTKRLEKELLLWQEKHQRLERENAIEIAGLRAQVDEQRKGLVRLAGLEARSVELEAQREALRGEKDGVIAGLQARVAELEPSVTALAAARGEVDQWQKRCQAEIDRRERELAELRERVDELEPMESTIEFLWEDKASLERTISTKDREIEQAEALRRQQVLELTATREALADLERNYRERIESQRSETGELQARLAELEPLSLRLEDSSARQGELEDALNGARERIAGLEDELIAHTGRAQEQEANAQRWKGECEDAGRQSADWEQRFRTFESDKQAEILSLQGHVKMLEPLVARVSNFERLVIDLETREREGRARITELEVESRRLTRELEGRTVKHDRTSERLADVERSLVESTVRLRQSEEQHAGELADLQGRIGNYASELAAAQSRQSELAARNRDQDARLHDMQHELSDSQSRCAQLQSEFERIHQDAQGKGRRISTLMAELDTASQEGDRVRREAAKKRSLVEAAESVLAELRPKLEALEAQLHAKDRLDETTIGSQRTVQPAPRDKPSAPPAFGADLFGSVGPD